MGLRIGGSSSADWGSVLANIARVMGVRIHIDMLRQMRTDSDSLRVLERDFAHLIAPHVRIFSFYETRPTSTRLYNIIVVDRSSAVLNLPFEVTIALDSNHQNLCKFNGVEKKQYHIVINVLKQLSSQEKRYASEGLSPVDSTAIDSLSGWVPNLVCKHGRTTKGLIEMAGSMDNPNNFQDAELDIVAVHGLGGSSYQSWINNIAHTLWLRDFLQRDFPNSRIMSYGYRADAALNSRTLDISLLASDMLKNIIQARSGGEGGPSRPLILIGYSFGGLLIKKVRFGSM